MAVNEKAVRKAVGSGRLKESVGRDERGRPFIADYELAVREWSDNAAKPPRADAAAAADQSDAADAGAEASVGELVPSKTLAEAQMRAADERRRKLKMENDLRAGRLVESAVAAREAFNAQRTIRESMLNLPARLAAELAAETDAMRLHIRLDAAIRDALLEAADKIVSAPVDPPLETAANE